jgi:hypothetical protein
MRNELEFTAAVPMRMTSRRPRPRFYLRRVAGVPAHFASHQLCSAVFIAGLDPAQYYPEAIEPKFGPLGRLIHYKIDRERREVRVSLAGVVNSRAIDDGLYGCRVIHSGNGFRFARNEESGVRSQSSYPLTSGPDLVVPKSAALSEALIMSSLSPRPHHTVGLRRSSSCITAALSVNATRPVLPRRRPSKGGR